MRTSNLVVYHYHGREINRLTARLSFLFLLVFPGGKAAEEGEGRKRKRERDVITSTSNPNRSEQRSSFVVHNWRVRIHRINGLFIRLTRMLSFDTINSRSASSTLSDYTAQQPALAKKYEKYVTLKRHFAVQSIDLFINTLPFECLSALECILEKRKEPCQISVSP